MKDKDKVKKYLRGISDDDICGNCSMSRHMHSTTTKNTCNGFVAGKGMTSHDGEARKDGWDE